MVRAVLLALGFVFLVRDACGKLVFTEIMIDSKNASDAGTNWFELYNTEETTLSLSNWIFAYVDNRDTRFLQLSTNKTIGPFGYLVIGNNANNVTNGGIAVSFQVNFPQFRKNGAGINGVGFGKSIDEFDNGDVVSWSVQDAGTPNLSFVPGASLAKVSALGSAEDVSNWKASTSFIDCKGGDKGTPGKVNTFVCSSPVVPTNTRCGLLRLGFFCLNGCGVLGRLVGICN